MGFGQTLRQEAAAAPDKQAHGQSGAWSIVLSAPGFMGGKISEWWLTAKRLRPGEPTAEEWTHLRKVISDVGGPGDAVPEHPILGTSLWRWPPAATDDTGPGALSADHDHKTHVDPDAPPDITIPSSRKVGRNEPCPCGSGKKYKKCCLGKPPTMVGSCLAAVGPYGRCNKAGVSTFYCKLCGKQYPWCADEQHKKDAQTMMNGHVMRVHPEIVPVNVFDKWLDDPAWMAFHEEQRAKQPELWARLFEYIDQRKAARGGGRS